MKNILHILPREKYDSDEAYLAAASERVVQAYAAVFSANATRDDADLVLVDLAQFSRYYDTTLIGASLVEAQALDQRRAILTRILTAMAKTGVEPSGLLTAFLHAPDIDAPVRAEEAL